MDSRGGGRGCGMGVEEWNGRSVAALGLESVGAVGGSVGVGGFDLDGAAGGSAHDSAPSAAALQMFGRHHLVDLCHNTQLCACYSVAWK